MGARADRNVYGYGVVVRGAPPDTTPPLFPADVFWREEEYKLVNSPARRQNIIFQG